MLILLCKYSYRLYRAQSYTDIVHERIYVACYNSYA